MGGDRWRDNKKKHAPSLSLRFFYMTNFYLLKGFEIGPFMINLTDFIHLRTPKQVDAGKYYSSNSSVQTRKRGQIGILKGINKNIFKNQC
jgi:hypothetical protein